MAQLPRVGTGSEGYGTESACWLDSRGSMTIWAFVGPVIAVIAINLYFFVRIMNIILRIRMDPHRSDDVFGGKQQGHGGVMAVRGAMPAVCTQGMAITFPLFAQHSACWELLGGFLSGELSMDLCAFTRNHSTTWAVALFAHINTPIRNHSAMYNHSADTVGR